MASAATHAVLPKLATREGRRLQIDAGLRSHRRRFGHADGFWLPECAYRRASARRSPSATSPTPASTRAGASRRCGAGPVRLASGPVAFTIDWPTVALAGRSGDIPPIPPTSSTTASPTTGPGSGRSRASHTTPRRRGRGPREHARTFLAAVAARLGQHRERRRRPGLCVFAIDTELLGHWWAEGPAWLRGGRGGRGRGVRLLTLPQALPSTRPRAAGCTRRAGERGSRSDLGFDRRRRPRLGGPAPGAAPASPPRRAGRRPRRRARRPRAARGAGV